MPAPVRWHHQQAVRLGLLAGHFGEELRSGNTDGDGQADAVAHVSAQPRGNLDRRTGYSAQPAHVEERLVHRDRLHQRRGVAEYLEHRVAGPQVGADPGRHHHGMGTQLSRLGSAHRRAHAIGLGLVADGQHHPGADDHRPAAQSRFVALFDRHVERVQVGVQDGRLATGRGPHEHMFAYPGDGLTRFAVDAGDPDVHQRVEQMLVGH